MARLAKLYISMAMVKSSRLLRNWKKDLNSSKVIPCKDNNSSQIKRLYLKNIKLVKCNMRNHKVAHKANGCMCQHSGEG